MGSVLSYVSAICKGLGAIVDAAVPVAVGSRTKISAVVAAVAPVAGQVVCQIYPPACPAIQGIGVLAGAALPLFAAAGLVRQ